MKKIEYKIVNYEISFSNRVSGNEFGEHFLRLLSEHGEDGWDLKEIIRESGMQSLLIFSRQVV